MNLIRQHAGEFALGASAGRIDPALLTLMDRMDELFAHQLALQPRGAKPLPLGDRKLREDAAGLLEQIGREDSLPINLEVARLRHEWMLTDDDARRDELTRLVADEFIKKPACETGYVYDVGYLCDERGLQRRAPRSECRRYSGWILVPDPHGDATLASLPSIREVNLRLPASIRPEGPVRGTIPPLRYRTFHTVRLARIVYRVFVNAEKGHLEGCGYAFLFHHAPARAAHALLPTGSSSLFDDRRAPPALAVGDGLSGRPMLLGSAPTPG